MLTSPLMCIVLQCDNKNEISKEPVRIRLSLVDQVACEAVVVIRSAEAESIIGENGVSKSKVTVLETSKVSKVKI